MRRSRSGRPKVSSASIADTVSPTSEPIEENGEDSPQPNLNRFVSFELPRPPRNSRIWFGCAESGSTPNLTSAPNLIRSLNQIREFRTAPRSARNSRIWFGYAESGSTPEPDLSPEPDSLLESDSRVSNCHAPRETRESGSAPPN